jgi:carboxyl-terminal processing protease
MLRLAPAASVSEQSSTTEAAAPALRQIADAFHAIQQQAPTVDDDQLADACIRGMLGRLDRHSAFLDKDDFRELQVGSAEVGGIGLELRIDAKGATIVAPIEGSPGDRAGLKSGDMIVEIDHASIQGLALKDVVKRLRGKPDTDVVLTVIQQGVSEPRVMTLQRAVIRIDSVKYKLIDSNYAYVRLVQFQEQTAEKMADALEGMWKQNNGQMKGIILDLRNDPGGLLNAAVAVSTAFLPQNVLVVYTDGRSKDSKMRLYASSEYYLRRTKQDYLKKLPPAVKSVPMVVLVNGTSAAASEIVAGALQDHKRARILGVRTFGQGTVQTILPLKGDTAIKLTTARIFRPSGQPIADAITPDFITEDSGTRPQEFGSSEDDQLMQATKLLRGLAQ